MYSLDGEMSASPSLCVSLLEHMHRGSGALCLPFRTAALAGYPWELLYGHIHTLLTQTHTNTRTHTHTDCEAISHFLHHLPPPKHTCTHVITALVPPSPPWCPWANSTLIFTLFPYIPPPPLPASPPPIFCHYSCVSAVVLSQSSQRWSRNTEGLQGRRPGPSVSPSCHPHFRLPLIMKFPFLPLSPAVAVCLKHVQK